MGYLQFRAAENGWSFTTGELANVRANIQIYNGWVEAEASSRGVCLVDEWSLWENVRTNSVVIGGIRISPEPAPDTTDLTQLDHYFLSDGIHPTPIAHAIYLNQVMAALSSCYGESMDPLADRQMLLISGLEPLGIDSVEHDDATGYAEITWPDIPGHSFMVFWCDDLQGTDPWDEVDGAALADIVDNGDGTWSWTDRGVDPDMGGALPFDNGNQRVYRVALP
jgi:hypothetical protein